MKLIKLLVLSFLVSNIAISAAPSYRPKGEVLQVNSDTVVKVIGPIMDVEAYVKKAQQIIAIGNKSKEVIIHINSPGGMVVLQELIQTAIESVQSKGVVVKCIVGVYAASAAFNILDTCDERYVTKNSKLLFHPVRAGGEFTAPAALELAMELHKFDTILLDGLCKRIGDEDSDKCDAISKAYYVEKWWTGLELFNFQAKPYLKLLERVEGDLDVFLMKDPDVKQPLFGDRVDASEKANK